VSIDLTAPEVKEAIQAAVAEATKGLVAKRDELLTELKEARKGKTIDPAELDKRDARIEELEGQLSESTKAQATALKEAKKATEALQASEGFTQRLLVDNGLTEALTKAGVTNPVHLKAVKSMLAGQVQIVADGDNKVAKVGEKALTDFVGEWAKGDEGKFFVAAPNNSGGGANGGNGSGNQQTDLSKISPTDKAARTAAIEKRLAEAGAANL
jgi:hypothetical protein